MRSVLAAIFCALLLADVAGGKNPEPEVGSINICQQPTIFVSGFAFYADREGNVFMQEFEREKDGLKERRVVLRKRLDIFEHILKSMDLEGVLRKPRGREIGVPDEVCTTVDIVLSNGVSITAKKWDNEKGQILAPIIVKARELWTAELEGKNVINISPADQSKLNGLHHIFEVP